MGWGTCAVDDGMANEKLRQARKLTGFLSRLRKDARGNTLALVAAAMIPLIALVGSGIDISRMYLVKSRLQQACDAGALAGRKQMGGGVWNQTTAPTPNTVATQFFSGNFKNGAYGTNSLAYSFSESSGDVQGTASVVVPMTMMKFFRIADQTMAVTCDAQMQIPNTDVMFVLDITGSMDSAPDGTNCHSGSGCKIAILKNAVKCFYESVAQYIISNANCETSPSNQGVSNSQIRFGFVPYNTNVNISDLSLPNSYFADSWDYQSREISWTTPTQTSGSCNNVPSNTNSTHYTTQGTGSNCKVYKSTAQWWYHKRTIPLTDLKGPSTLNGSFTLPIGNNYSNATISWNGCLEEAKTVSQSSYSPIPSSAYDLNIDLIPSQSDSKSLWAPSLPQAVYLREDSSSNPTLNDVYTTSNEPNAASSASCPTKAKKLASWSAADFQSYVDSLSPGGNTYHDIGMIWGGRLLSPKGIFKNDNEKANNGGEIQRHMIFMTDGDAQAYPCDYTAYGVSWYDRRTTSDVGSASKCSKEYQALDDQVNSRLAALCTAVKNEPGTTLWVISFGGVGISTDTKNRLTSCATDANHYFDATDKDSLNNAFKLIAAQITQLRLTK